MKQGSNRRPRSRANNNNKRQGGRNSYDSNGPDGKVRGTAQQVLEKYQALGRDATSAGDRIAAEAYFQFAEHYYRLVHADDGPSQQRQDRPSETKPAQENENIGNVAENTAASNQPTEVVNVPIMPGPIDTPVPEDASDTSDGSDATASPSEDSPAEKADSDEQTEPKRRPVRRRRPRVKPEAQDEAPAQQVEA